MIIGLCGPAGSGKDEVANILVRDHGYTRVALADPLRAAVLRLDPLVVDGNRFLPLSELIGEMGWDRAKRSVPEVRQLLQRFGTEVIREMCGPDVWVDLALGKAKPQQRLVVTDCRFDNEAVAVYKLRGRVLRVCRQGVAAVSAHVSEHGLGPDLIAGEIDNNGDLADLPVQIVRALETAEPRVRWCPDCAQLKAPTEFGHSKRTRDRRESYCRACCTVRSHTWVRANADHVRGRARVLHLQTTYGITVEQYDTMLEAQGGVCLLCLRPAEERALNVDHCHETGAVRGLLCNVCNSALHPMETFHGWTERAQDYLNAHNPMKESA